MHSDSSMENSNASYLKFLQHESNRSLDFEVMVEEKEKEEMERKSREERVMSKVTKKTKKTKLTLGNAMNMDFENFLAPARTQRANVKTKEDDQILGFLERELDDFSSYPHVKRNLRSLKGKIDPLIYECKLRAFHKSVCEHYNTIMAVITNLGAMDRMDVLIYKDLFEEMFTDSIR